MIQIYESSNLKRLADLVKKHWSLAVPENPLLPEQVVVQNNDMARWLTLHLAEAEGIAANLDFKFPAELFWDVMRMMQPDIPDQLSSERGPMAWQIFHILQTDDDPSLSVLHQYTNHEEFRIQEMRSWHLACRISDVFDQYLPFRPEMLLTWENERLTTNLKSEQWQAYLWCKLLKRWQAENEVHRAKLQKKFLTVVERGLFPTEKLPHRMVFFGPIDIPPSYFKLLTSLGQLTDIKLYRQKFNVEKGHLLVQSFNRKATEFEENLKSYLAESSVSVEREYFSDRKKKHQPKNFFGQLKNDIQFGLDDDKTASIDSSFQVHSCHSTRREMEVLYDQLLFLMDQDETLNPSDITIVCPQIEEYAADIEAVFGTPEANVPEIPFHISNGPVESDPIESGFKKILDLVDSRFKMTEVIDLLECEPVRDKLELSREEIGTLNKWITENRIRWGIDGSQKKGMGLPDTKNFTWQSGLHRMMAGYSMEATGDSLFHGIYPYDEIAQFNHGLLLGKLSRFMHQLFKCYHQVQEPKTPGGWNRLFRRWLSDFFIDTPANHHRREKVIQLIDLLNEESAKAGWEGTVSFQVVCDYLENAFQSQVGRSRQNGGGVTFCAMISKHGIPAKYIGMIGMNDGDFPRSKITSDFDLMARKPQNGDRSPAKDDRQLFLNYLLVATNGIYFSFVGQSNHSDSEYPPSAVLQELIDYIVERYSITENDLITEHRLQPFSRRYFTDNKSKLFSYSQRNKKIARQIASRDTDDQGFLVNPLPELEDSLKEITLRDFIAFFQHPSKYLLQRRLGINLREEEFPDDNRESFELSPLTRSQLERELGKRTITDQSLQSYYDVVRSKNLLPDGWPGQQKYISQLKRAEQFTKYIKSKFENHLLDKIEIDYREHDIRIVGRLGAVYGDKQLLYRFGKKRPKDLIELWIKHLMLQLVKPENHPGESQFLAREKKNGKTKAYTFKLVPLEKSNEILNNLIGIYQTGLRNNTMFFPKTSYAYAEAVLRKGKNEKAALRLAGQKWNNPHLPFPQEGNDPYNLCLTGNDKIMSNKGIHYKFEEISIQFWKPFFKVLDVSNEGI